MDFKIEKRKAMKMIGFERVFSFKNSYREIPRFWDEFRNRYCEKHSGQDAADQTEESIQQTIAECIVGEYGVSVEDEADQEHFRYYIAGPYQGGEVPKEMKVFDIPASEWAKFKCIGAMPDALQMLNNRIFSEWLPGNQTFEAAFNISVEWYSCGDIGSADYESAIWIPVKRLP